MVQIAGIWGLVEEVNLRRTVMRDLDGAVHSIPNGEVKTASNYTKEWSRVNLNIPVAYGEDLENVMEVINRVGKKLAEKTLYTLSSEDTSLASFHEKLSTKVFSHARNAGNTGNW